VSHIDRRTMLRALAAAPLAAGFAWTESEASIAGTLAQAASSGGARFTPKFFTPHEWQTVRTLVDVIIPRDERSGSATDAGVPEFMDFMMLDQPARQTAMRGGLAWIDVECQGRFDKTFLDCTTPERIAVLDAIAWDSPDGELPVHARHGIAFFNTFRDLTATGFWTTKMGIDDLGYLGNRAVRWTGCPDEALTKLGVRYP
jgi:hypothetical protein